MIATVQDLVTALEAMRDDAARLTPLERNAVEFALANIWHNIDALVVAELEEPQG